MKTYDINGTEVREGIAVALDPYPHVVLGEGGHKRATWIALGKRDAESIIVRTPVLEDRWNSESGKYERQDTGRTLSQIKDVVIIALKDTEGKPNGKYLIVAPRNGGDNRVLVLWRVSSGYRGGAGISAGEGVTVIASDSSWHSGRGNLGETAEMLAILKPGQELRASRSGRRVQNSKAKLVYDGKTITVTFGGEEMEAATADEVEGEYL
jgi:hypothetical protein